jgi:N-acetylmuramoyl-L-alanine amidase
LPHPIQLPFRSKAAASALAILLAAFASGAAELGEGEVGLRIQNLPLATRVILEFPARPAYQIVRQGDRVTLTLQGSFRSIPYKSKKLDDPVLDRYKLDRGSRQTDLLFFTGPEFGSVSSFEMTSPFRLILDFQRRSGAPPSPPGGDARVPPGAEQAPPRLPEQEPPGRTPVPERPSERTIPVPTKPPGIQVIVVDAGHGGSETGAKGPTGLLEKDVTLDVARRIQAGLSRKLGVNVILTREGDKQVPLDERTAIANHERADLFLSIHVNASRAKEARGAETYFLSYQATDDESRALAALENNTLGVAAPPGHSNLGMVLWDLAQSQFLSESSQLAETIQQNLNDALRIESRGVKQAPFRVLMGATMPAVLVEIGFITNGEEEARLKEGVYRDRIAAAIVDSVAAFKERSEKQLGLR